MLNGENIFNYHSSTNGFQPYNNKTLYIVFHYGHIGLFNDKPV